MAIDALTTAWYALTPPNRAVGVGDPFTCLPFGRNDVAAGPLQWA
jgi:hypothetical protein